MTGRGRGRAATLPAWMTKPGDGPSSGGNGAAPPQPGMGVPDGRPGQFEDAHELPRGYNSNSNGYGGSGGSGGGGGGGGGGYGGGDNFDRRGRMERRPPPPFYDEGRHRGGYGRDEFHRGGEGRYPEQGYRERDGYGRGGRNGYPDRRQHPGDDRFSYDRGDRGDRGDARGWEGNGRGWGRQDDGAAGFDQQQQPEADSGRKSSFLTGRAFGDLVKEAARTAADQYRGGDGEKA
ncbi:hypothetical protein ATCC90586_009442 [Pythium insidiosum]|nr:hypothetical protein ATCC90586_009442 [Pythium insidiosum]